MSFIDEFLQEWGIFGLMLFWIIGLIAPLHFLSHSFKKIDKDIERHEREKKEKEKQEKGGE